MKKLLIILITYTAFTFSMYGQADSISINIGTFGQASNNELQPLWLHANEWGLYPQYDKSSAFAYARAKYHILNKKNFKLSSGLGGLINTDLGESFLHEFYLHGKLWMFNFSVGKEAYSPTIYNDHLSTGLFITSSNARPIPKVTVGIFDYLPLGFTKKWVEVRGGITQGWLNDDRGNKGNSANDVLLHEKFAYMRLGNVKVQPYVGLIHSALFGGTRPNGDKIPIDFWATFTAQGSSKLGGGEETNSAGAHMGLWDFGVYFPLKEWNSHLYYQKPFADASGLKLYNGYNKDHILGLYINRSGKKLLSAVSMEWIKTDHQSGYGIPDPIFPEGHPREGQIIWMHEIDDFDQFMWDTFGEETEGWGEEQVMRYLEVELNEGHTYGGRDDYMNNGTYYSGWTYHGQSMGTPLYHTAKLARKFELGCEPQDRVHFVNNRVNGFHMGVEGWLTPELKYRLKGTFTKNIGSYGEEFIGRYSWDRSENYLFEEEKVQSYLYAQLDCRILGLDYLSVNLTLGVDFGDLYNSTGGRVGLVYAPSVKW